MPARSPHSFRQITDILYQSLKAAFDEVCPERYGAPLTIRRVEDAPSALTVSFRIAGAEQVALQIHVTVSHVGGNVYDVITQVEDGPSTSFCYCLSETEPLLVPKAPHLAWQGAAFLLDTLERRVGHRLLSETAQGPRSSSPRPSSSTVFFPVPTNP